MADARLLHGFDGFSAVCATIENLFRRQPLALTDRNPFREPAIRQVTIIDSDNYHLMESAINGRVNRR